MPISYTNREPHQKASLEFELIAQFDFGDGSWSNGSHIYPYRSRRTDSTLDTPLAVAPETTVRGDLLFKGDYTLGLDFDEDGTDVAVERRFRVRLRVIDHVSGARIERELPPPLVKRKRDQEGESAEQQDA